MAAKNKTTYREVLAQLKQKQYAPVYFLCGDEAYYIDYVSDYIEHNVLDEMSREFDQTIIYAKDLPQPDVATVVAAARRFPMMGEKQVIIVKEAQNIKKWESLGFYMERPVESTLLVFCYKYGKPDGRMSVFREFEKHDGVMMESPRLYDNQVPRWIMDYVAEWGRKHQRQLTIEPAAALLISDSLGNNLTSIVSEIEKLIIGSPEGTTTITPKLVERNIGISKDYNIFELEKALIAGDALKANRIVLYFADSKDHPIQKELPVLFSFFSNLMIYHYLPKSFTDKDVAAALKMGSTYFVADYVNAAKRFNGAKTMRIIGYIRDTDARSKGINNASADDKALWQELIYKIMH